MNNLNKETSGPILIQYNGSVYELTPQHHTPTLEKIKQMHADVNAHLVKSSRAAHNFNKFLHADYESNYDGRSTMGIAMHSVVFL